MSPPRPLAVAFDVVETLFSLDPVRSALDGLGAGPRGLDLFFARLLRDGFALAAAGDYRPFRHLADGAVEFALPASSDEARERVLAAFEELPAHPDAEPALARLVDAGVRVVALTNGGAAQTEALMERAGLDRYVEEVLAVEEAGRWKPAPSAYHHAARAVSLPPGRLALVAVHAWDVHGARRAGLLTGWASRLEGQFPQVFDRPDVSGRDLVEVVEGLMGLGDGASA